MTWWKQEILTGLGLPTSDDYITAVDRWNERLKAKEEAQEPEYLRQQRHAANLAKMREEILAEHAKLQGNP